VHATTLARFACSGTRRLADTFRAGSRAAFDDTARTRLNELARASRLVCSTRGEVM